MPDITMCQNKRCTLRLKCERFLATPNPYRQSYSAFIQYKGKCQYFKPAMNHICHACRIALGYERKDKGAHTATMQKCFMCETNKLIIDQRHWKLLSNPL